MRFIGNMGLGPNWESSGKDGSQGAVMKAHYDYMNELYERGVLLLGGPYKRVAGGLTVLECPSKEAAAETLSNDPAIKAGLTTFELFEQYVTFDAFAKFVRPFPGG